MDTMTTRYFIFSKKQMDTRISIEGKTNPNLKFGTVVVGGVSKIYTDIITDMKNVRYGDSILLIKGDIRTISFTEPS